MSGAKIITALGIASIILYILIQILNFYGVGQDVYGIYLAFIIFMIINFFMLPTKNAEI